MKVKVKNMSWDNEQKKEIETIKERKITVRLSDADCDRLARKWFERCWFGMFPEETLLKFLLYTGYDVYDDFLEIIDDIENGYAELEDYKKDQSAFDEEEIEFLKTNIDDWEKQIAEIKSDYLKKNEKADWEKEVEKVNEWWKAKERLINE